MKKHLRYLLTLLLVMVASVGWADTPKIEDFTSVQGTVVYDTLNRACTGITGTNYSSWTWTNTSTGVVYAGQSAGGSSSIQLRSNNNNSGVVTTTSAGKARKVTVTWNSNTTKSRTLNVYGKNSAYTAVTDLYNSSNQGTLIGTIVCGTSTELSIADDYEYIGFRSASGAMYLTEVIIEWEEDASGKENASVSIDATELIVGGTPNTATISTNPEGLVVSYSSDAETVATVSSAGVVSAIGAGTATITVTWDEQTIGDKTYKEGSQDFVVKVYAVEDGFFNFEAKVLDYGTGLTPSSASGTDDYIVETKVWTAGNVTLTTAGKYRWWANDGSLRLYVTDNTNLSISAPTGNVITKIEFTDIPSNLNANVGSFNAGIWTGSSNTVIFTPTANVTNIKTIKVTYEEGAEKADPELAFSESTATATLGEPFVAPTLTNPNNVGVTYESSEPTVATVDPTTGEVTLVAKGTTIISATFAGDDDYFESTASYTLTVIENIRVAYEDEDGNTHFDFTKDGWGLPSSNVVKADQFTNNGYTITLAGSTGNGYKKTGNDDAGYYLIFGKQGAYLTLPAFSYDVSKIEIVGKSGASGQVKQNIYVDSEAVSTETTGATGTNVYQIDAAHQAAGKVYTLKINSNHNTQITEIIVYKKLESVNVTIGETEYATLYYSDVNLTVPEGVTAKTYKANGTALVELDNYSAGDVIPAGTGVVLNGAQGDYTFAITTESGTASEENMLRGSDEAAETTGGAKYYMLSLAATGGNETVGFYYGATDGAAFTNKAHRAYLAVPEGTEAKATGYAFNEVTGINDITREQVTDGVWYTIDGKRLNGEPTVKGIYVVNGKKVVIK